MAKTNWDALKRSFITSPERPSVATFAATQNINAKTLRSRASREKWLELQTEYWDKVATKSEEKLSELQATHVALDTAQRLLEIRKMQLEALKWAGGGPANFVEYDAKDAVAAYDKLVKLERLLSEQSTENISVSDSRAFVAQLVRIIREEVSDPATIERISNRVANLGAPVSGGVGNLN